MKRLNPETGEFFKLGDTRSKDDRRFVCYQNKTRLDGYFYEQWLSPKAYDAHTKRRAGSYRRCYERGKEYVDAYKMQRGCACCSWKDFPEGLDFDHKNPEDKVTDVCRLLACALPRIKAEIAKCIVLCACCHRLKTANPPAFKKRWDMFHAVDTETFDDDSL